MHSPVYYAITYYCTIFANYYAYTKLTTMNGIFKMPANAAVLLIVLIAVLATNGCKNNDPITPSAKTNFGDLKINPEFKFSTTKELDVNLEVISSNPQEPPHRFNIYNGNPEQGGKLIISGITDPYSSFQTNVKIPAYVTELYVTNQNVNNEIETVVVDATGNSINYSFDTGVYKSAGYKSVNTTYADPGCTNPTNATILTGSYSTKNIDNNTTYRVAENTTVTITTKADFKGGTLIVCGTLIIKEIKANNSGGDFVISSSGNVELEKGNVDKDLTNFINYGTIEIESQTTIKDFNLENHGIFIVDVVGNGADGINAQTEDFYNYGTMTIDGNFNNNDKSFNSGTLTIDGHFNTNGNNREFTNECKMIIGLNFNANGTFNNEDGAYVSVGQNTTFGGSSTINMGAQSLITTVSNLTINDKIVGPSASCARFDVGNNLSFGGGSDVSGYVDFCDATSGGSGDHQNGVLGTNVTFDCSCYVPTTSCNAGAGTPPVTDTDNDGCPDNQDDYPNDPLRCSNDYYPNETDFTSLAFEDLWTGYGDYDFNDLVMQTNYKIVKNYSSKIVEVYAQFHIAAVGAGLNNGFGVEFDVPANDVTSVTGIQKNGSAVTYKASDVEDGQTNAVVIVYDAINSHLGGSMINTEANGTTMEIETITVHILFTEAQSSIGTPPYNPFIFVGQNRGKEIHKIDDSPTDLANLSLFGQGHDDSDPNIGRYYVSSTNLPWAIEIPYNYEWPYEKVDILNAYLKFQNWAETSGDEDDDWYEVDNSTYRNQSNIYQTPAQ